MLPDMSPPLKPAVAAQPAAGLATPLWLSDALFQGRQEIVIRHDGQDYRLRITRMNKMILTK